MDLTPRALRGGVDGCTACPVIFFSSKIDGPFFILMHTNIKNPIYTWKLLLCLLFLELQTYLCRFFWKGILLSSEISSSVHTRTVQCLTRPCFHPPRGPLPNRAIPGKTGQQTLSRRNCRRIHSRSWLQLLWVSHINPHTKNARRESL